MSEKRLLVLPSELVKKINDNRGDMSIADFINFLIESQLKEEEKEQKYATKEEVKNFSEDTRKLLKSFLDFFVSYGLELGEQSPKSEFEGLTGKLQELEKDLASESKEAKIKWK